MKKITMLALLGVALAVGSLAWADHHEGEHQAEWFDATACEICSPMAAHPELMAESQWETHKIKNGMLMVALIPEKHKEAFAGMCKMMKQKGKEIASSGTSAKLCGFCESYQDLTESGAKEEIVETEFGNITLLTSSDYTVVQRIHRHAARTQEEAKKMAEMMAKQDAQ